MPDLNAAPGPKPVYMAPHAWNYTMRLRGETDALVPIEPQTAVKIWVDAQGATRHALVPITEGL